MILIGILAISAVLALYALLYYVFLRRTAAFMEKWEREIKERINKELTKNIQSLQEAAEAIKLSREGMEHFLSKKEILIPKLVKKSKEDA